MGCIARLGCLVVLVILGVVCWFTRGLWMPERFRDHPASAAVARWEPVTDAGAERTRTALTALSQPRGPVFQSLSAGDVASFAFDEISKRLGNAGADSIGARIDGDRMSMRASVKISELHGQLGPLASMLGDRETVELTGTFHLLKPGLGEFEVQSAKVGNLPLPQAVIPRLIKQVDHGRRPDGLPENALPLPLPKYVSDIRIANGKVTVYKNMN